MSTQPKDPTSLFQQKVILITGATGFLGKVYFGLLASCVTNLKSIQLLIRGRSNQSGTQRYEEEIFQSPAIKPLHDYFKSPYQLKSGTHIEILEGNISDPRFGLSDCKWDSLVEEVDLLVNSAGLVDFSPDLRQALQANVMGALNCVDLVASSKRAKLAQISTCYVAGTRDGVVLEELNWTTTPSGYPFDPEVEWAEIQRIVGLLDEITAMPVSQPCQQSDTDTTGATIEAFKAHHLNRLQLKESLMKKVRVAPSVSGGQTSIPILKRLQRLWLKSGYLSPSVP